MNAHPYLSLLLALIIPASLTAAPTTNAPTTNAPTTNAPATNAPAATAPAPTADLRIQETPEQKDARMAWWRKAKFGMFIHWGLYAIPAEGEWHMRSKKIPLAEYQKYAAEFNPTQFNADTWAAVAEDAGMKYMVPTTKHHDGFAMFHSKTSPYNIYDATPFKRDPLKELAAACPKHGIRLGVYYSVIADWGHPGGGAGCPKWDPAQEGDLDQYINTVSLPQVKELLTNYGPIAELWFDSDGAQPKTQEQAARYAPIIKLQPKIIVDPRLHGINGDFDTAEGHVPELAPKGDWELCDRTNGSWGYTPAPARPLKDILTELIDAWGKGGNVLLNVGPDRTGVIPADSVARLHEVGNWMRTNGEAIYGSKGGPFSYLPWGSVTQKGDTLYLLVRDWPTNGKLVVPMDTPVTRAHFLADAKTPIKTAVVNGHTVLTVPTTPPDANVTVIALKVNGTVTPYHSLLLNLKPTSANEEPKSAGNVTDDDSRTDWRVKGDTAVLEYDLGKPTAFDTFRFKPNYSTVTKFTIEVQDGVTWKTIYTAAQPIKKTLADCLPLTTGQHIRLTATADKPELRIAMFELYPPL